MGARTINLVELIHWQTNAEILNSQLDEQRPSLGWSSSSRSSILKLMPSQRQLLQQLVCRCLHFSVQCQPLLCPILVRILVVEPDKNG